VPRTSEKRPRETGASLAVAALELAREGVEVFPCGPDKAPRTRSGFHDASSDEDVVSGWSWDDATIGAAIPAGTVVLDVDPRNGGDATMRALKEAGHKLPRTRVVKTGGGGTHYYFRVPDDVELRAHLGEGVDVKRAGRGYVIVPPSDGYRLLRNEPPADLPDWLLDSLRAPERTTLDGAASAPKFMPWEDGTAYGTAALERTLGRLAVAPEGGRNDALNKAAFAVAQLVAGGELDAEKSQAALEDVAERAGLRPDETRKTLASGWEAGLAEPRQAPPREAAPTVTTPAPIGDTGLTMPVDEGRFWLDWTVDEEPPRFLLHPILPENAYVVVYGPAEASKSMTFVALLADASRRGIRSTVYSLENPPHIDRDRVRRLNPDAEHFRITNEPLDLNDPAQFNALVEREKAWGTRLILIDTYSHAFSSRSEDGNAKAIEFARRVRFLMHETGATVAVVDHTGYGHDELRDASAKKQQVDVAILMKKAGDWHPGQPARFSMENRKAARFGNPFTFTGQIKDGTNRALELGWIGKAPTWED
jgi:hypothetical protein